MTEMYERKYCDAGNDGEDLEVKANTESRLISGFSSITGNVDLGGDLIEEGAYFKALKKYGTSLVHLKNHNADLAFARTLELHETTKGLAFTSKAANTLLGDEMLTLHAEKVLRGMSFGYSLDAKGFTLHDVDNPGAKGQRRTIHQVKRVWEISSATFPMNLKAGVTSVKDINPRDLFEMWNAHQELKTGTALGSISRSKLIEMGNALIEMARYTDGAGDSTTDEKTAEDVAFEAGGGELLSQLKDMKNFFAGLA